MGVKALLSTLPYKIKADAEGEIYKKYMAKCAKVITENTAKMSGGGYITVSYNEIIEPCSAKSDAETRTGEEIISSIKGKLGRMADKEVNA